MSRNLELKLYYKNFIFAINLSLVCASANAYLDAESLEYEKQRAPSAIISNTPTKSQHSIEKTETTNVAQTAELIAIDANILKQTESLSTESDQDYSDPYEKYNRFMYSVNKKIDKYIIKPPAQLYAWLVPLPVKYMVTNFFENLQDVQVLANDLLQGEIGTGTETFGRIILNSTYGMFGLIDVAKDIGIPRRTNDFGITFGKWGFTDSSYFIIPVLGPSTVRDTFGTGASIITNPIYYYLPEEYAWGLTGLFMIDKRANLLSLEKIIDTVSDDEYIFVRNSYFTYRDALIRGEKPNVQQENHEQELIENIMLDQDSSINGSLEELPSLDEPLNDKPVQKNSTVDELSKVPEESNSNVTKSTLSQKVVSPNMDATQSQTKYK